MKKINFIFILFAVILLNCFPKEGERIPAKIAFVSGTVLLNGKDAQPNDFIKFGDVIETKARSSCTIIIDSQNIIAMKEDSAIVYHIKKGDAMIDLKSGFLSAIIKNKKNIQSFRIKTPTVTASIRGSALFIGTESPTSVYTCLCNGVIHYHVQGRLKSERHTAAHHKAIVYREKLGMVFDEPDAIKYHTDEDVENLAKLINVYIDWTKISE
ncbi:MAG: FecR family protein [Spirochaetes bacterium]|nr:FecR family protein [Spirochaetota bacterium]